MAEDSGALFWRRRVGVLLLVGALVGLVCWPLAGWLSQARTSPAEGRAAAEKEAAADLAAEQGHAAPAAQGSGGDASKGKETKDGDAAGKGPKGAGPKGAGPKGTDRAEPETGAAARQSVAGQGDATAPPRPAAPVCAGSDIAVTVRPERADSPAGRPLAFQLLVRNGGDRPCRIPADPEQVRVAVLGGSQRVLDTDRCPAAIDVGSPQVKPERTAKVTVRWNGRHTGDGCSADSPFAQSGTYSVQAEVLGAYSTPTPFALR